MLPISVLLSAFDELDVIDLVFDRRQMHLFTKLSPGSELGFDGCVFEDTKRLLQSPLRELNWLYAPDSPQDVFFNSPMQSNWTACCPLVFFTDSDGKYVLLGFRKVASLIDDCDMALRAKTFRKAPGIRHIASTNFNQLAGLTVSYKIQDGNSNFRRIRWKLVNLAHQWNYYIPIYVNAELSLQTMANARIIQHFGIHDQPRHFIKSQGLLPQRIHRDYRQAFCGNSELHSNSPAAVQNEVATASISRHQASFNRTPFNHDQHVRSGSRSGTLTTTPPCGLQASVRGRRLTCVA